MNTPSISQCLLILVLFLAAAPDTPAQQTDIRISPSAPPKHQLNKDVPVYSAARSGNMTLVAWGSSPYDSVAREFRNTLLCQLVTGAMPVGTPRQIHNNTARPYGAVAVLALDEQFMVLWNDRRSGAAGIYGRLVDTLGSFIGDEWLIAGGGSFDWLNDAASMWLHSTMEGYRLVWRDTSGLLFSHSLDSSGGMIRAIDTIDVVNFDSSYFYSGLPGLRITYIANVGYRLVHANGSIDERSVSRSFYELRHYLNADTSFAALRQRNKDTLDLAEYRSIFDEQPFRITPVRIPVDGISGAHALGRDSAGHYRVLFATTDYDWQRTYIHVRRVTVGVDDKVFPPLWIATLFDYGSINSPEIYEWATIGKAIVACGDENATEMAINVNTGWAFKHAPESYSESHVEHICIDQYGNLAKLNPQVSWAIATDIGDRVPVTRITVSDSSVVQIKLGGQTVRLAAAMPGMKQDFQEIHPFIVQRNGAILVGWLLRTESDTYNVGIWNPESDSAVRLFPASLSLPPSGQTTSRNGSSYRWRTELTMSADFAILQHSALATTTTYHGLTHHGHYKAYLPTTKGWTTLDPHEQDDMEYIPQAIGFDPNTGMTFSALYHQGAKSGVELSGFDSMGTLVWRYDVAPYSVSGLIPLGTYSYISVSGQKAQIYDGTVHRAAFDFPTVENVALTHYQRFLGDRFLRIFLDDWKDSADAKKDVRVVFEMYDLSGHLLRRTESIQPGMYYGYSVVERPADSAIIILQGGVSGVHATVFDKGFNVMLRDTVISSLHASMGSPTGIVRNDSLFVIWEDFRNDGVDIYGCIWKFPPDLHVLPDLSGNLLRESPAVTIARAMPVPLHMRDIGSCFG